MSRTTRQATSIDIETAEEILQIEEADSWFEYLELTKGQTEDRYLALEPWAWARLTRRLKTVYKRRASLDRAKLSLT